MWAFGLVYPFDPTVPVGGVAPPLFVLLFATAMIATAMDCDRNVSRLSRVAAITAPLAAACTVTMRLFPEWAFFLLYALAGMGLAPLLVRRVHGAIQVFAQSRVQPLILTIVPAVFVVHMVWILVPLSPAIRYAILAVIGLTAVWRVQTPVPDPGSAILRHHFAWSRPRAPFVVPYLGVLLTADFCYQLVLLTTAQSGAVVYPRAWSLAMVASGMTMLIAAVVLDRGIARSWLMIALSAVVVGIVFSLTTAPVGFAPVLLFLFAVGGGVTQYQIIRFLPSLSLAKRPAILFSAVGVTYTLVRFIGVNVLATWLSPRPGMGFELPRWFYVTALILTIGLLAVTMGLLRLFETGPVAELPVLVEPRADVARDRPINTTAGRLDSEQRRLMASRINRSDIPTVVRKPAILPAEAEDGIQTFRRGDTDLGVTPHADAVAILVAQHGLTAREADILRDICDRKTNAEIASERFITEHTVKFHVCNLLAKLHATGRRELRDLVARAAQEASVPHRKLAS